MLEVVGAVVGVSAGIIGLGQIALRIVSGPTADVRDLCARLYSFSEATANGDVEIQRFKAFMDEIGVLETRTHGVVYRRVRDLGEALEGVWFASPLRPEPDGAYTRTPEHQTRVADERWAWSMTLGDRANDLMQLVGRFDRWTIAR